MKNNPIMDFRAALERAGLRTHDPIIADGKLHRFHVTGDSPGSRNGWYVLHADGISAGKFGSWKQGVTHSWCSKLRRSLRPVEHAALRRGFNLARAQYEAERVRVRQEARVQLSTSGTARHRRDPIILTLRASA